jgi:HSP20 family protein
MALMFFDPTAELVRLQSEIERFFDKPLSDRGLSGSHVFPPINVFSDKNGLVVRAEIPGFKRDQIKLEIEPRRLTLQGETEPAGEASKGSYHRRERRCGKFARSIQLPEGLDTEKAAAECRNGILTVHIPNAAVLQPRRIEVAAA